MTWLDFVVILIWVIFLAAGARLGSLWTGALIAGGFLGSFLGDSYALLLSPYLGSFHGIYWVTYGVLYCIGLLIAMVPGFILSRLTSALYLGVIDGFFGLLTGAFTGFLLVTLNLLFVLPYFPAVEKTSAWKNSVIVKPLERVLEEKLLRRHAKLEVAHNKVKQAGKR